MLKHLKLVVFDYPKYLPKTETNQKILSDLLSTKQESYHLSDDRFVAISGLDFIGTHLMVYDTKDIFQPRHVLSVRNLSEDRAKYHKLKMPTEDYLPHLADSERSAFYQFKEGKAPFCESGALYIDSNYTFKKTGFPLVEIGMMMILNNFIQNNTFHFAAATNLTFKSTRWVSPMGHCQKPFVFDHPYIRHPHELMLMEDFNFQWLARMHEKYFQLWTDRIEIRPSDRFVITDTLSDEALHSLVLNQTKLSSAG